MDYVQITTAQRRHMLDTIGIDDTDALYESLPRNYRLDGPLNIAPALAELDLRRELETRAGQNEPAATAINGCFLGGGAYDHFIPATIDALASQGAFLTAYTPYQAEASQGALQAFFEFQTMVCRLTGMEVANASLYDGSTAVAEAVIMALNATGRRRVVVADTVHPHHRAVLQTYLADLPVSYEEVGGDASGTVDPNVLRSTLEAGPGGEDDVACVVVQSPNVFGRIEPWSELFAVTHEVPKRLAVAIFNPIACGLLARPGSCDADIAVGEGQPLGIPLQFGGPYLGLFATRRTLMRKMPGRLIGQTVDTEGRRAFCLTLQTREQHIRGAKATSNVCTNQGLLALRAAMYLAALGPDGLRDTASQCYHRAHHAAAGIAALPGYTLAHDGPFFHEFVVNCPVETTALIKAGRGAQIMPGLDCAALGIGTSRQLLIAVTEKRTAEQIAQLVQLLRAHT